VPDSSTRNAPVIALVAGEHSGDQLGAGLIRALRQRLPHAKFVGVCGPKMSAEGCEAWASSERLAVMGIFEVVKHLPDLLRLRREIRQRLLDNPPRIFVGIDAPEFNLGLARQLRRAGIRTVQYVSPQVWAWRQGRVRGIANSVDLVLCLLPFEQQFYEKAGVRAEFVGHPLADQIPLVPDRAGARRELGLDSQEVVAVLPGSRMGEVSRLAPDFAGAMQWMHERRPGMVFVAPMANARVRAEFERVAAARAPSAPLKVIDGHAQTALAAADGVLVASGTATLETTLSKRPMVVAYRLGAMTSALLRSFGLFKAPFFAQPNLLAGRKVVPELFQEAVTPQALGAALLAQLDDPPGRTALERVFTEIHQQLRRDASSLAAEAIVSVMADHQVSS
jgi:lipid-A-disaccharide synthase